MVVMGIDIGKDVFFAPVRAAEGGPPFTPRALPSVENTASGCATLAVGYIAWVRTVRPAGGHGSHGRVLGNLCADASPGWVPSQRGQSGTDQTVCPLGLATR